MEQLTSLLITLAALLTLLPNVLHANQPVISHISKDVVASVGEDVQFNCTVENVGRMSVSWAKRSVVLSMRNILSLSDPRYTISETRDDDAGSATYSLKITKIEASDMGPYECQVIVSATDKITKKLNLSIKHPPIISEERTPKSKLVTEGQNLEVSCHATGFPQPTLWWKREDNAIMPAGGPILSGHILRIKEVHRLDRGAYYCVADNGVGQPDEHKVLIEVEFRPQIAVLRPKVAQVLAHVAELECSVQGYPAPAVFWYRNGAKLQSNSRYEISNTASSHETTTSVLRIASVSEPDFGDYYCNATNKLGHTDARLHLFQPVIPVPSSL
ncbi:PREDICTED: protein amalgam [Rhagoletis zephyria]|uniref:protein amalgam n=1 Tax=Rhagoletis zephyria TaxID=28612 RepID=UPI0008118D7C|nr:PREDICTED: protein amalgam [Rhagoletis zephyria]XP_036324907.1 protein amalgam [Rhagoletis pomonella]